MRDLTLKVLQLIDSEFSDINQIELLGKISEFLFSLKYKGKENQEKTLIMINGVAFQRVNDFDIYVLGLSTRVDNILRSKGINDLGGLIRTPPIELARLTSKNTVLSITQKLSDYMRTNFKYDQT